MFVVRHGRKKHEREIINHSIGKYKKNRLKVMPMNFQEFQEKATAIVNKLDAKQGIKHDTMLTLMHLVEEFGEIARELYNEKSGRGKINKENLALEIADVMILLTQLANCYTIDLEKALKKKLQILEGRYNHAKV